MNDALKRKGAAALSDWYLTHNRPLPWRQAPTPYRVWVSEIMLQQTRIEAVLPYYERFMVRLPDVPSLAAAPEDVLLKLWEGLGYYSRVRNLQKAALITKLYWHCPASAITRREPLPRSHLPFRFRQWTETECG